ncbi:hypothetical protein J1N35_010249 [Gossypium stocksii]|uniref:Uncharacterized protein n=1 Tax=Gossypium stocksii TaxID=47602 RepID=A0A9D3W004_9ROSI|nr:hypothetical protein J1N35_010249 [Gossypium stocksii]
MEEDDDAVDLEETFAQWVMLGTYLGDDDNEEEVYRLALPEAPPIVRLVPRRNLPYDHDPLHYDTHSLR